MLDVYYPETDKGFRRQGFAVVSVNYRLFPKCKCPDNIDDAAMAVAWVFDNIEKYGGNKEQIYVSGHSAGGYLTLMVALAKEYMAKYGQDADKIAKAYPMFLISGDRDLEMLARYEENAHLQALLKNFKHDSVLYEMQGFNHGTVVAPAVALITSDIRKLWKEYQNP